MSLSERPDESTLEEFLRQVRRADPGRRDDEIARAFPGLASRLRRIRRPGPHRDTVAIERIVEAMTAAERAEPREIGPERIAEVAAAAGVGRPTIEDILSQFQAMKAIVSAMKHRPRNP